MERRDQFHIGFLALARPTFDLELANQETAAARRQLAQAGHTLVGPQELILDMDSTQAAAQEMEGVPLDLLVIFQATFADSTMVTALAGEGQAPLLLWAVPEHPTGGRLRLNSLCGINLAGHALTLRGRKYDYLYASPESQVALEKIEPLAKAGRAMQALRSAHIGVVGVHPAGMDTCRLDAAALERAFGVQTTQYAIEELFGRMDAVADQPLEEAHSGMSSRLGNSQELDQVALRGTLKAYLALDQLAAEEAIDGLAVRCWPEIFEQKGCAACGALSLLNDSAIPSSCEADANGTVTQLILQAISGEPTFDCDIVSVDRKADQVVIWHCGKAPLAMADPAVEPAGGIHSNRKVPLVMEFPLKPGRITAARVSRAGGSLRLVTGGGEMLSAPKSFSGTSGVVRFDSPASVVLDTLLMEGLEHHLAITYGDHQQALLALAHYLDLPTLQL